MMQNGTAMKNILLALCATMMLGACVPAYQLVKPGTVAVGDGSMSVTPRSEWNAVPANLQQPAWEESWTQNGPLLESIVFVGGVPDGKSLVKHRKKDDAQVAVFRADMTPNDLVSMIESAYRVGGVTVFAVDSVDPAPFLGGTGLKMSYHYAPGDGIGKRGTAVLRVVDKKLYLVRLDGVTSHYYEAAQPEFEQLVASATLQK
jgi:hypothetical protein